MPQRWLASNHSHRANVPLHGHRAWCIPVDFGKGHNALDGLLVATSSVRSDFVRYTSIDRERVNVQELSGIFVKMFSEVLPCCGATNRGSLFLLSSFQRKNTL